MNKRYRETADIKIAFAEGLGRQTLVGASDVKNPPAQVYTEAPVEIEAPRLASEPASARKSAKSVLRPFARLLYRMAKPLVRPFAARFRRYLLDGAKQQFGGEFASISETLGRDISALRAAIADEGQRLRQQVEGFRHLAEVAARRVAIPVPPNNVLVRTAVGYVVCPASDYAVVACLVDGGELERGTRLLLERLLEPGSTFIDVGANIGLITLAAARAMNGVGTIIAYEPFGETRERLEKSIWLNGFSTNVQIHEAAVSRESGTAKLYLGGSSGFHSLFPLDAPAPERAVEVKLVTLDETAGDHAPVDVVKIDVEGAELEVLEGCREIIDRSPDIALIVELGPSHLERTGTSIGEWLKRFEKLGLVHKSIHPETGELEMQAIKTLGRAHSTNLLFARPESAAWKKVNSRK